MKKTFDYSRLQSRTWDREILNMVGMIHEFRGRQQIYLSQEPESLDKLTEIARVQSTEASNAIEGIVITDRRLTRLMAEKTVPMSRDEGDIKGYRFALNIIHEKFDRIPVTKEQILLLHKEMYRFSDTQFGGNFKKNPNEISAVYPNGEKLVIFKPLEPSETPEAIEKICEEYGKAINRYGIDPLVAIPVFIHDFLCIHPFTDGNGRMSRLLTTLLLCKSNYAVGKYISLEKKIHETKEDYYDALNISSRGWSYDGHENTAFVKYLLGIILAAYRDLEERINTVGARMTAREMVEKAVGSRMGGFTKRDIQELCPEIGRSSVENSLKAMCEEGLIKREGKGRATVYYVQ